MEASHQSLWEVGATLTLNTTPNTTPIEQLEKERVEKVRPPVIAAQEARCSIVQHTNLQAPYIEGAVLA